MTTRIAKMSFVWAMAFLASLVSFGNVTDYFNNYQFVHHVFLMDTTFPGNASLYRAIASPVIQHAGYILIILLETATAVFCWLGGYALWRARSSTRTGFRESKKISIIGLSLGFLTWQVSFMSIGGEWFGMWMSSQWNGVPSAYRFFSTFLLVLVFVSLPEDQSE